MNIGEASKASGVSTKMIRYYEKIKLIPHMARSESGYRVYTASDVHRLGFIRRARNLGFSVSEIEELLSLWYDRSRQSAEVQSLAHEHIADLDRRIKTMREMANTLRDLSACHPVDKQSNCPKLLAAKGLKAEN